MNIVCNKVDGFECFDEGLIKVIDRAGNTIYLFDNEDGERITFNLPEGNWLTDNEIYRLKKPLTYISPELPKPDKNIPIRKLHFIVKKNPNKCSIDVRTGRVIIDYSIDEKEYPFKAYILYHECGHFLYKGGPWEQEAKCDIFAAKHMLEDGFNFSQITYAQELCLGNSDSSENRKNYLYNWLKKVQVYE